MFLIDNHENLYGNNNGKKWLFYFNLGGRDKRIESIVEEEKRTQGKLTPIWGSLEMVQKGEGKFPCLTISWVVLEFYA